MYKLDYKNAKKAGYFGIPFLALGLLFLVIFGFIMFSGVVKKSKMDSTVEAYDVKINSHTNDEGSKLYTPTYYYKVNGVEYTYTPSYSTNVGVNDMKNKKIIYYNSKNPNDCVAEFESKVRPLYIFIMLLICIFPFVGIKQIIKSKKNIKNMKWLAENGTLIKNLKYNLVPSNYSVNDRRIMMIEIEYELPSGSKITLTGTPRFDRKIADDDGMVDLLIDLNNPENYYIDFNIE